MVKLIWVANLDLPMTSRLQTREVELNLLLEKKSYKHVINYDTLRPLPPRPACSRFP